MTITTTTTTTTTTTGPATRRGWFGEFGGAFVPELLAPALEQLERAWDDAQADPAYQRELAYLLADYAGRPTPLYACRNLAADTPATILLKREDLLHGGAHKTNQVLGQALLAQRMGKTRLIAETGAGQHGVATALAGALLGLPTRIYMGAEDIERQRLNVFRMRAHGAEVVAVDSGSRTLKDAVNEALRDWASSYRDTHYLLGTAAGPHPFPTIVRELQRVIGREARAQCLAAHGRLPDVAIACVGGGSNAIGLFADFVADDGVALVGVEAAGRGLSAGAGAHAATLRAGSPGALHGARTLVLQDDDGQVAATASISAGLDYPGVGPEHAHLQAIGRATYVAATDDEALAAFGELARAEGILPALESAHALAYALRRARAATAPELLLVNLSGRGDKDVARLAELEDRIGQGERRARSVAVAAPPVASEPPSQPSTRAAADPRVGARYRAMFERMGAEGRGAFVPFTVLGDPSPERSLDVVDALVAGGADALELGIPFSDPVADGPTVQAAVLRALDAGTTTSRCWELLAEIRRRHPEVPIGLLVYAHLVVVDGAEAFYRRAAEAGVDSILVADAPLAEADPLIDAALAAGVAPVLIAPADAAPGRVARIAAASHGYVYVLARAGVTGTRDELRLEHGDLLARLVDLGAPPALIGFGISRPEHVRAAIEAGAAGAISGSAVVQRIGAAGDAELAELRRFVEEMRGAC